MDNLLLLALAIKGIDITTLVLNRNIRLLVVGYNEGQAVNLVIYNDEIIGVWDCRRLEFTNIY